MNSRETYERIEWAKLELMEALKFFSSEPCQALTKTAKALEYLIDISNIGSQD